MTVFLEIAAIGPDEEAAFFLPLFLGFTSTSPELSVLTLAGVPRGGVVPIEVGVGVAWGEGSGVRSSAGGGAGVVPEGPAAEEGAGVLGTADGTGTGAFPPPC